MFKNAKVYRLTAPFEWDALGLDARLAQLRFRPCGPQEVATMGFASPLGPNAEVLAHPVAGAILIAARRQERLLPGSVVSEALAERVAEIEQTEVREVNRRERSQLREELLTTMLPQAFTRSRLVRAYIDPAAGWVVVDASSDKVAEDVLSLLRKAVESLPVKPLKPGIPVAERLTGWVAGGQAADGLTIEDQCVLRDPGDAGAVVRCRGIPLDAPEIQNHLASGKRVVTLGLTWNDHLSLLLDEDLGLKRLKFADEVREAASNDAGDDAAALFDAEFALLALELRGLLARLVETFVVNDEAGPG